MRQSAVLDLVREQLGPLFLHEKARVDALELWISGQGEELTLPRGAKDEHRRIAELARTPLLPLVITNTAQALFVDGYKSPDDAENAATWRTWQANDFDTRQSAVHRAGLGHGLAWVTVLPGVDADGPRSVMRGTSARKMVALYADPAEDDWPMFAMRVEAQGGKRLLRVFDEECVYFVSASGDFGDLEFIEYREHGADVCPVVRHANQLDLDGRSPSDIDQLIPLAARHNKTTYDRLLTQHYNSWKVRTIAGLQEPADDAEAAETKMRLRQDDILVAEDADTKFGTLDETPLAPFIEASQADLDTLSAVAQVPSTALSGKVANLSADAIAELRAGLVQKVFERQQSFGAAHTQALRLAHRLETGEDADVTARVTWRDMQPRTIAQVVDALGKAATMLEVPPQSVWHLIPGFSKSDVDDMKAEAATKQARDARMALRERAAQARADVNVRSLGDLRNAG